MSWIDDLQDNIYSITTGDGRQWFPKFRNPVKVMSYNFAQYNFENLPGSLIRRKLPEARQYQLEFYFDGEDCVDAGNAFSTSADNPNPWTLSHQFYGDLTVQPVSTLDQSNVFLNQTAFTCTVAETLQDNQPLPSESAIDTLEQKKQSIDESASQEFALKSDPPDPAFRRATSNATRLIFDIQKKSLNVASEVSQATSNANLVLDIITATTSTTAMISRQVQRFVNFPTQTSATALQKSGILRNSLLSLSKSAIPKPFYELAAGATVSALALSAAKLESDNDYQTRADVFKSIELIAQSWYDYLVELDGLTDEDYQPSFDSLFQIYGIVFFAISELFTFVFDAKQERRVFTDVDTNVILLSHRYYGLASDENIAKLVKTNNIGLNELMSIPKGRE